MDDSRPTLPGPLGAIGVRAEASRRPSAGRTSCFPSSGLSWSRTALEAGTWPAPSLPRGRGRRKRPGRRPRGGCGSSPRWAWAGRGSPAHRDPPTMASCGRRRQECSRGSRAAGRRRPGGGAGAQRQPLTCPGSSHFSESGGAPSTCLPVRGRGGRRGAWPGRGPRGDGAESSPEQGRRGRDGPPSAPARPAAA